MPLGALPGSKAQMETVADWLLHEQQASPLGTRIPRFACSVAYHVNTTMLPPVILPARAHATAALHAFSYGGSSQVQNTSGGSTRRPEDEDKGPDPPVADFLDTHSSRSNACTSGSRSHEVPQNYTVEWSVDVLHMDYPAAASTRAASVGGQLCDCTKSNGPGVYPNATVT